MENIIINYIEIEKYNSQDTCGYIKTDSISEPIGRVKLLVKRDERGCE